MTKIEPVNEPTIILNSRHFILVLRAGTTSQSLSRCAPDNLKAPVHIKADSREVVPRAHADTVLILQCISLNEIWAQAHLSIHVSPIATQSSVKPHLHCLYIYDHR